MSRDMTILIALALILALAGVAVFFILGDGGDVAFVPADESNIEAEEETGPQGPSRGAAKPSPSQPGKIPAIAKGERPEGPQPDQVSVGEEQTGLRGIVKDPKGSPVAKAVAAIYEDRSDLPQMVLQGAFVGMVETNAQGRFAFEGITAGVNYVLRVEHPDFASSQKGGIEIEENEVVNVVMGLELGIKVEGEVVDEGGNPIAGARVRVVDQQARAIDPTEQIEREVETGPDGRFVFGHINAGYKRVSAIKESYATETKASVHLRDGQEPDFLSFTLGAGVELRGRVVDQDGNPVADAVISAQPVRRRVDRTLPVGNYPPVKSDEKGEFTVAGVAEGTYRLTCVRAGFGMARRISANTNGDPVVITLRKSPVVRGRVVDAETGDAVTKFRITLGRKPEVVYTPTQQTQVFKSEDGTFEYVDATIKGDFYVHAVGPGYAWGSSALISVPAGQDVQDVVISLGKGGTIRGQVTDASGKPVANADVIVRPEPDIAGDAGGEFLKRLQGSMKRAAKRAKTDAEGRYEVTQMQAGLYTAKVSHPDFSAAEHERNTAFSGTGELNLPTLALMRGATVIGVVEAKDGKSGANCTVRLSPRGSGGFGGGVGGETYTKRSDSEGRFSFEHVRPGIYWVDITDRDGDPGNFLSTLIQRQTRTEVMVADGETREVRVK